MGREFPVGEIAAEIHPFLSISLFLASISATLAIVSSLCGMYRKKTPPSPSSPGADHQNQMKEKNHVNIPSPTSDDHGESPPPKKDTTTVMIPPRISSADSDNASQQNEEFLQQQPLPPPPGLRHLTCVTSHHYRSDSTASSVSSTKKKIMPKTMSMNVLGNGIGLSGLSSRQSSKRDQENLHHEDNYVCKKKDKKLKHEDSIWKKTIILGEKCRIPDEDDDAILYDEKGNRISTYHRKSTTSVALSRQNSCIDQDAIPSSCLEGRKDHDILRIS